MEKIPENWHSSTDSIIETGRLINRQKKALSRREYKKWIDGQPIGRAGSVDRANTARKIGVIAKHHILGDPTNTAKLPPHWGKLYEASYLPDVFLRDKINNGGLVGLSRHKIYKIRNRPVRGPIARKFRPGSGARIILPPQYKKLSDWVRAGLALEANGKSTAEIGLALGLKRKNFERGRIIVMIYDRNDLNAEDHKLAAAALAEMDTYNTIHRPLQMVQPLVRKIYGSNRGVKVRDEERRKEGFARAISVINDTCFSAVDVKIPFLGEKARMEAINHLLDAVESLTKLVNNIRRSGND